MATSGTYTFNLDLGQIMEEAYERCNIEMRTGFDYRTARRSLDLLMLEWQNRGLSLWTVKDTSVALTPGTGAYTLTPEKLDIVEAFMRTNAGSTTKQSDLTMQRISIAQYSHQTNKLLQGRPIQYWVERAPSGITVNVWPIPDSSQTWTLGYYYMEREAAPRIEFLKQDYEEQWNLASDAAREKASLYVVPGGYQYL